MMMGAAAPIGEFGSTNLQIRRASARRTSPVLGTGWALPPERAYESLRKWRGCPNGEFRYRQASGHRAPSVRHRRVPGAANRQWPPRPSSTGLRRSYDTPVHFYAALHNIWWRRKRMPGTLLQFCHAELLGDTRAAGREAVDDKERSRTRPGRARAVAAGCRVGLRGLRC